MSWSQAEKRRYAGSGAREIVSPPTEAGDDDDDDVDVEVVVRKPPRHPPVTQAAPSKPPPTTTPRPAVSAGAKTDENFLDEDWDVDDDGERDSKPVASKRRAGAGYGAGVRPDQNWLGEDFDE